MTARPTCPHCNATLEKWATPEGTAWGPFLHVCFNDDCPYYVRGWTWMEQQYGVRASYRYRVDAFSGFETPVPVWSSTALRNAILPDDASRGAGQKEHP